MIDQTVSHYKILEKLGEGGMGAVYLAEDMRLGRKVAVKFLSSEKAADPESRRRFIHEAKAQAMVSHPNVAIFHDVGEEKDKVFIVMEYIEGQKLSKLAEEKHSLPDILDLAIQIAEGVSAAHECGIMHRDVNPNNIMVSSKGVAKITDFGLAKWKGASSVTPYGAIVGTDRYIAPELFKVDEGKADHRADVFSLGVVLYELICGQRPFEGETKDSIYYEILWTQPQPLAHYRRETSKDLERIVSKCLAKKPKERFQSVADLVAELKIEKKRIESEKPVPPIPDGRHSFWSIPRRVSFSLAGVIIVLGGLYLLPGSGNLVKQFLGMRTFPLPKNLVILPFTNVGGDPANQALCNGLGETVNSQLSQLEKWQTSLRVVPAGDVRKDKVYTAERARKIFGATLAVKGELEGTGRGVRLTVELVDTKSKSSKPLRSVAEEYAMADIAAVPEWTVRELAEMMEIKLPRQALQELGRGSSSVSSASLSYFRGRGYLQHYEVQENLDMAIALLERALREDPMYGPAYAALGEAYWHRYQATKGNQWRERTIDNCTKAVQLDAKLIPAYVALGQIRSGDGRYPEAVEEFQKVLGYDSLNVEASRALANAYEALGQTSRAESTYLKAIKLRPNYPAGYSHLGAFFFRRGQDENAVAQFERVVELAPENYRGYNSMGGVYIRMGRSADAIKALERSLEIEPDAATYSNLGTLYFFEVGSYAEAARMHEKALEIDSSDYRVWGNLASAYYWAPGERAKARAAYQRAAQIAEEKRTTSPRDAELLSLLANYYSLLGKEGQALPLLEHSLLLAPDNPEVLVRAARSYEQLGLRGKALEYIEKALKKGYPLKKIQQTPGLAKLRQDARFLGLAKIAANKPRN